MCKLKCYLLLQFNLLHTIYDGFKNLDPNCFIFASKSRIQNFCPHCKPVLVLSLRIIVVK